MQNIDTRPQHEACSHAIIFFPHTPFFLDSSALKPHHFILVQSGGTELSITTKHWVWSRAPLQGPSRSIYLLLAWLHQLLADHIYPRQFYQLSKVHHPDHNPQDPQASDRFVRISEAYAILGNPEKRSRYDRDTLHNNNGPTISKQRGSHSSSSTPFGSRPASGLSRRRTQFKGPPPSFYRSGGWGQQSAKRQSQANATAGSTNADNASGGGLGPGQGRAGLDHDVPHFDREGHARTQAQQDRRRRRRLAEENVEYDGGGSVLLRFALVGAVISFAWSTTVYFSDDVNRRKRVDDH